ncbi:MAG: 50S ribosomal protein L22 [Calditrichaeota bacterium]|nr:MAG: 50S ribosomal protein L22 [Calditrichota bacterium]
MEATAKARYVRISPLKVRQVLELIRGKDVETALNVLHFCPKRAAKPVEKALRSAVANFFNREEAERIAPHDIYIKRAFVDGGPMLKRFRPMAMGRAGRIRKRTSHITIVVEYRS